MIKSQTNFLTFIPSKKKIYPNWYVCQESMNTFICPVSSRLQNTTDVGVYVCSALKWTKQEGIY